MIKRRFALVCFTAMLALAANAPAFAQAGASSSISGTVVDSAGGAIPGASVMVKNTSGTTLESVTNSEGVFSIPAVGAGTYTVTVSLAGFKTRIIDNLRVEPGAPASVMAVLEVGQVSESVTVTSSSELINTQSATVSSTLNSDQLNRMPTPTRNALNAVAFLPGVNTTSSNRNSSVNGLPDSFMNIMLDGVSNNDQFLRSSDGFFASVTPRQDAIEAVTVTTAVGTAQVGGSGAININFVTRSGSNRFGGTGYYYWRDTSMNSNYWFNERNKLPRNDVKLYTWGGRASGPISIPGLFDGRDKAFYMVHYEQIRFPNSFTRFRTVLHPSTLNGVFRYTDGDTLREVNVLQLAASNGQISATDPLVMSILQRIQAATATTGAVNATSNPLVNEYVWQSPGKLFEHQPTIRLDYNITGNHRLSGSAQFIKAQRNPDYLNAVDARFPGAPNFRLFTSKRPLYSTSLRSTLSQSIVNEVSLGLTQGGASYFGDDSSNGPQTFQDQNGFAIVSPIGTDWHATNTPSWRSSWTYNIGNTVNWQKGSHALSLGAEALLVRAWEQAKQVVPGINLGFSTTNDPARGLFTTANFPGASSQELSDARAIYALLTGRVSAITGLAALQPDTGEYVAFAPRKRAGKMDTYSMFIQDAWRATPALTINAGVRYSVQLPFTPENDTMTTISMEDACGISGLGDGSQYNRCNFYVPGSSGGKVPVFSQFTAGTRGYETDWDNFAPNVGVAWRPNVQDGFLRAILGDPDQATLRAGYSIAYDRVGMSDFTGVFGPNQGSTLSLTRNEALGNLVLPGEQWPVLLSETNRLGTQPFPLKPSYPIAVRAGRADTLNGFAPDLKVANAHTWTVSFQRALSRDMAVDIRYVGTKGVDQWSTLNYNEVNIENNGFFDEFKLAMGNLAANNAAGGSREGSFAYFGAGTGTSPLPIHLAYLVGSKDHGNPAAYTGGSGTWTNATFTTPLVGVNPNPFTQAANLIGTTTRFANGIAAGFAPNFFIVNPSVGAVNITDSGAYSDYHALQIDLKRRLSKGLQANINYQYAIEGGSAFRGFRYGRERVTTTADHVRHAVKTQWDWSLPIGRGERYGTNWGALTDALLGGWNFSGVGRIQAGLVNFGTVRLVGMTAKDVQKLYKHSIRIAADTNLPTVFTMPDDIILNTRRAFSVSTTSPTGYGTLGAPEGRYFAPANSADCINLRVGDCSPKELVIRTPWFTRFDVRLAKRFPIRGAMNLEFALEALNVLDNINFNQAANPGSGAGIFQVGSAYTDASNTYDPGGRLGQLMFRFNW